MTRSTVSGNTAEGGAETSGSGGGIVIVDSTASIEASTISGNNATGWYGSALFVTDGVVNLTNVTVAENVSPAWAPADVFVGTFAAANDVISAKTIQLVMTLQAVNDIGLKCPRQTIGNTNIAAPTPHSLRHSFAVNTLKRIKDKGKSAQNALPVLAAYLGHSEYKHTVKYLKLLDAEHRYQLVNFIKTQDRQP